MRRPPFTLTVSLVIVTLVVAASTTALGANPPLSATATGFDISWPQCASDLPSSPGFGIVGVNNGSPFTVNKCLDRELRWANQATNEQPAFYVNTGNPGPVDDGDWPSTQNAPKLCKGANSVHCSYDYGWNAGRVSFADVENAEGDIGAPSPGVSALAASWWLDVETGNAWETKADSYGPSATSKANDAAMLEGEYDYLASVHVANIGIYSTTSMWLGITGGSVTALNEVPAWIPGSGSIAQAEANCAQMSFTGGRVALTQYPSEGYDGDYACGLLNTSLTLPVTVAATPTYSTQLVVTNSDGPVTFVQTSGTPSLLVSPTGLVTTSGQLAAGMYSVSGTTSDAHGDTGTFSLTLDVGTIVQLSPVANYVKVPSSTDFSEQLIVSGNSSPATFVQTTGTPKLIVSATGLVTTGGPLSAGVDVASGTMSDASGEAGTFTFSLTVGKITQNAPTSASIASTETATFTQQLSVSRNDGPVTFVQTNVTEVLLVSSFGLVTTAGPLASGTYIGKGTTSDAFGDKGTFTFTLSVLATPTTTTTSPNGKLPGVPRAVVVKGHAVAGKTVVLTIIGSNFFAQPIVLSHAGTTAIVTHDTGRTLTVRVRVRARSRPGDYVFTITFANGQICRVRYVQR